MRPKMKILNFTQIHGSVVTDSQMSAQPLQQSGGVAEQELGQRLQIETWGFFLGFCVVCDLLCEFVSRKKRKFSPWNSLNFFF